MLNPCFFFFLSLPPLQARIPISSGFVQKQREIPSSCFSRGEGEAKNLRFFESKGMQKLHNDDQAIITRLNVLKMCQKDKDLMKVRLIHAEVVEKNLIKKNVCVATSLITTYSKYGAVEEAREVFEKLPERDVVSWSALISGYVQHGYGRAALKCFEKMQANGIYPDAITYACSLKACGSIGAIDKGRKIHSEIDRNGLLSKQNLTIGCALINMYSKCGFLEKAQQVFDTLPIHNSFTWNALISGYAQCGEFEDIISYFDMMIQKGHKPDPITFLSILNSCSHAGLIEKGQTYYHVMAQVYGIIPNILHYACFIDVLGRAGQLDKVEAMILRIPFCPNTGLWLSMLGSCKKWCNADLGRYAFKHVVEIE